MKFVLTVVFVYEDVFEFDVAMDDWPIVQVNNTFEKLLGNWLHLAFAQSWTWALKVLYECSEISSSAHFRNDIEMWIIVKSLKNIINEGIIIGSFQHKQLVCQKILLQHSPHNFLFGDTLQAAFHFGLPMNSFPDDSEASLSNDFTDGVSLIDIVYEFKVLKLPVIECIIV